MPQPIRYQSRYPLPAAQLYATLVDREYLEAKLKHVGGTNAALLELHADPQSAKYTTRQGVDHGYLPGPIQLILRGDLIIDRTETWRLATPGRYDGSVTAHVRDAPGSIGGTLRVSDLDDGSGESEFSIEARAKVNLPLVGGKIESAIADQVHQLMEREGRFTSEWLSR
jgi:hypothetical protein